MYQFLPDLQAEGIDVTVAPLIDDALLAARYARGGYPGASLAAAYARRIRRLFGARRYDLVWIEYELFPWLPGVAERLLAAAGVPYVVEYDDAVFHRYDLHPRRVVRGALGGKIDGVMRGAATVIAGNAYLAGHARAAGARHVVEIPSVVDTDVYQPGSPPIGRPARVGWIGSPTTAPYLHAVAGPLARLVDAGSIQVTLVGVEPGAEAWAFPCIERRWNAADEVADVQGFDIGIMPLPDEPWERGKCGYKLVQYMACGRPVVASPVGANRDIVRDGVEGRLATTPDEWDRALSALAEDVSGRVRMGAAGRARAEQGYSRQSALPRLAGALKAAAGAPSAADV
jgi:glycosyltransferase involved in cell wall biosynthesis